MISSRTSGSHSSALQPLAMNENTHHHRTAVDPSLTVSKTPATTRNKNRRALGDISNRKVATAVSKEPPAKSGVAAVSFGAATTATKSKAQQSRVSASKPVSLVVAADPKPKTEPKAVTFDLNDDDGDVEVPAGRLWVDQQQYDDDDSSWDVSLEGVKTAREDLLQALEERYQRNLQLDAEEEERCLQVLDSQVELFLKQQLDTCTLNPPPCLDIFPEEELVVDLLSVEDDSSFTRLDLSF